MRRRQIVAALLSSVLALVVAEALIRTFMPRRTIEVLAGAYPAMFEESDYLPYRLRPGYRGRLATEEFDTTVRINSRGYRGDESPSEQTGAFRILVIGDSFTFGWGVQDTETYVSQLQQLLAARDRSRPVDVINAGFAAGYSPDTYYLYLKREGLAVNPDLVIVGVYVGNDLDSPAAFENEWLEQDADGLPLRISNRDSHVVGNRLLPRQVPLRYRVPVLHRLHLFQGAADLWWMVRRAQMSSLMGTATLHARSPANDDGVPYIYRTTYAERTNTVMKRVEFLFRGMKRVAAEAHVPLLFVIIPAQVQMNETAFSGLPAEIDKPQRLLREFFEREDLPYVDLLPPLRGPAADRVLYFPLDAHWNAAGHAAGARQLVGRVTVQRPIR